MDEVFTRHHELIIDNTAAWKAWLKKKSLKHTTGLLAQSKALNKAQMSDLFILWYLLLHGSPIRAVECIHRRRLARMLDADGNFLLAHYHDPANAARYQHLLCMVELIRMA